MEASSGFFAEWLGVFLIFGGFAFLLVLSLFLMPDRKTRMGHTMQGRGRGPNTEMERQMIIEAEKEMDQYE